MYRKYYSINDMPKPIPPPGMPRSEIISPQPVREIQHEKIIPEPVVHIENENAAHVKEHIEERREAEKMSKDDGGALGFLNNFKTDDIILAVVILALILNDCDDKLLLLALAFVFIL